MSAANPQRRPATEEISRLIERVTFHNEENGFCVLRVKTPGRRDETTVIGSLPSVTAGEWLVAEGRWVRDKEHGLQFKATTLKTVPPTTAEGIERYLGSGLVKGIGPILAKKLVGRFGAEILAVIENRAAELQSVDGIGPKRRERIARAWQEAKQVREIMLFLHSHGVSTSRAVRIFKTYGEQAIEKVPPPTVSVQPSRGLLGGEAALTIELRICQEHRESQPRQTGLVPGADDVPHCGGNVAAMKGRIKIPPRHKLLRALRRASRRGFVGACVWCGHGYRRFSLNIQAAHLKGCAEYQRAKAVTPVNLAR